MESETFEVDLETGEVSLELLDTIIARITALLAEMPEVCE